LRQTLASTELFMPTGLVIGPDGAAYVSNNGIFPALAPGGSGAPTGQVIRIPVKPITKLYILPFFNG
jgi:hypothetical protein